MSGITVNNITKAYGDVKALDGVSLTLESNRLYGLLGRNGAGKTTLLNIIANRVFPDSGEITIDGEPWVENAKAQGRLFMMSEENYFEDAMKVCDVFKWMKEFYPAFDSENAAKLCDAYELSAKKKVKSLSTGYGSILKLICALSVNAPYVFFDEPVLGLDANNRDLFYRQLLEKYSEQGGTYVISTHLIEEVAGVIENILIIKKGKLIRAESRDTLLSSGYTVTGPAALVDSYTAGRQTLGTESLGGLKTAYVLGGRDAVPDGLEVSGLDLQKLFIQLTNS